MKIYKYINLQQTFFFIKNNFIKEILIITHQKTLFRTFSLKTLAPPPPPLVTDSNKNKSKSRYQ